MQSTVKNLKEGYPALCEMSKVVRDFCLLTEELKNGPKYLTISTELICLLLYENGIYTSHHCL